MIFISKNIFTDFFLHKIEFWIYFISFSSVFNDWWSVFDHFHWWNRAIGRSDYWWSNYLKNSEKLLYLDDKSVIINIDCIRTINLNQIKKKKRLTIDNMCEFSIMTYVFNIVVLVICSLMLIFCLFKLNVNNSILFISSDLRFLIEFCWLNFFDV